jgi:hypothetical protein
MVFYFSYLILLRYLSSCLLLTLVVFIFLNIYILVFSDCKINVDY